MNKSKINISYRGLWLMILLFFVSNAWAQEMGIKTLKSEAEWQSAKDEARNAGKNIFLDIYASWCGPCKMMEANVYTNPSVAGYFNKNFVNLKVDGETEFGLVLASKYKLSAYPSMYFINPEETVIYELVGYRDTSAFLDAGKKVREFGNAFLELNTLYSSGSLPPEKTDEFIDLLAKFGQKETLSQLAAERISSYTKVDILNPANKDIILSVPADIDSPRVKIILENALEVRLKWGTNDFNHYLSEVFNLSMQKAAMEEDTVLLGRISEEFVPVFMMDNPGRIPEGKLTIRKIYFSELKDWNNYISSVEKYFRENEKGNLKFLYNESFYIIQNQLFVPELLDKAKDWMNQVVTVQPDFESMYLCSIVDTYRQDFTSAKSWLAKAEGIAKTQDEKDSLEELRSYLGSMAE